MSGCAAQRPGKRQVHGQQGVDEVRRCDRHGGGENEGFFPAGGWRLGQGVGISEAGKHFVQVVESILLRLPACPLRLRPLIDEQRQPRETLVERVARLRPLGDSRQVVVFERAR